MLKQVGEWIIIGCEDDDGHLSLYAKHTSQEPPIIIDEDLSDGDEIGWRLTVPMLEPAPNNPKG